MTDSLVELIPAYVARLVTDDVLKRTLCFYRRKVNTEIEKASFIGLDNVSIYLAGVSGYNLQALERELRIAGYKVAEIKKATESSSPGLLIDWI